MGNAPSKEPQGRPFYRLSKPRVASHQGPLALLSPNGQLTTSNRSSDPGPDLFSIPYSSTAASTLSIEISRDELNDSEKRNSFLSPPRLQRRRSLFRSKSSQECSERCRYRRNTVVGSPSPPAEPPQAVSRANSVNLNNLGAELNVPRGLASPDISTQSRLRASWAHDLLSHDAQRVLSLVPEQVPCLPRSYTSTSLYQPNLDGLRRPARRRDSLPVQPTNTMMTRSTSEVTLHPPMRRRSIMQTPGVATRTVRPTPVTTRTSYRHSLPATPHMSRQASFDNGEGRAVSFPPLPSLPASLRVIQDIPRVVTPVEDDYGTTGVFKFGTLRITNGGPDLTPDISGPNGGQVDHLTHTAKPVDYFTKLPPREDAEDDGLELQRARPRGKPAATGKRAEKSGCPADLEGIPSTQTNAPTLSVDVPSGKIDIDSSLELLSAPVEPQRKAPASPVLQTQSKHTAAEDQLFEAEDDSETELHTAEVLDVRVDPSARRLPSQCQDVTSRAGAQAIERSDSGFVSNAVSDSSNSHSSLAKADSGYSSSVSLRSFRSGRKPVANTDDTSRSPAEQARDVPQVQATESKQMAERAVLDANGGGSGDERAPTPPPKDAVFVKPAKSTMIVEDVHVSKGKERAKQLAPINTSRGEGRHMRKSESVPPTPASARSDASESASSLSISSTSQKHGRLHRFLSLRGSSHSRASLTVHVTHAVDEQVPAIPKDIEKKLHEHSGRFPMSAKRLALKSHLSQETLKTILSVGSLELSKEDELPATPAFFDDSSDEGPDDDDETVCGDTGESSIRQTITSMQSNFKQAASSMMLTKKPGALKPVAVHKEAPEPRPVYDTAAGTMSGGDGPNFGQISASTSLHSHPFIASQETNHSHPREWPRRSMTMTNPTQESRQQLRTYSLNTMPSSHIYSSPSPGLRSRSNPSSRASSPPKRLKSPPPVSVVTRARRPRPPPVDFGYEAGRSAQHSPSYASRASTLNPQRSLDSVRRAGSLPSTFQYRATDWEHHTGQSSLGSQNSALDSGRHNSLTAHNEKSRAQAYLNNAALRRQSSTDGFSRNRLHGGHHGPEPRSPHGWSKPPSVHRRNYSAGSGPQQAMGNPPYRVLHSYNSPAYRNAPIWG